MSRLCEIEDWFRYHPRGKGKVLLREKEVCRECGNSYLSLYPLTSCVDHDGLDGI
ncbi:MAG: hypothetical protein HY890_05580 [Deltaproteobacteria bacterium]|nr:hypothetical protein [Deltaproteobacteria bacterium]